MAFPTGRKSAGGDLRRLADDVARRFDQLPPVLQKAVELIRSNLGERLTVKGLGNLLERRQSDLNVSFRRATGLTIRQYALSLRMASAAREIQRGVKIDAVALQVGFRSRKNFYRQFETWFGTTPTGFRAAARSRPSRIDRSPASVDIPTASSFDPVDPSVRRLPESVRALVLHTKAQALLKRAKVAHRQARKAQATAERLRQQQQQRTRRVS